MAANLSPEYLEAEREYKSAVTQAEKIAALERMLSTVPKHKGTEKLQADIKRKLAQARRESEKKGTARATPFFQVEKEGAGQVALVGPPNAGKSQLLATLTRARPEIADYPFTTRLPVPGMMPFENIQIQLIDLPPFSPEFMESWLPQAVRNVNAAVLLVDVNDAGVLEAVDFIEETFAARHLPRPDLLAANKIDLPGAAENFDALADLYRGRYRMLAVSALTGRNLEEFRRAVYETLRIVRVYTKVPGKPAELKQPFILKRGLTVEDAARLVHRDFAENLKYARLYRMAGGRDGLMVERTHTVEDEDILEFHV